MNMSDSIMETLKPYLAKLVSEQESLVARFLAATGAKVEEICIVERETQTGRVFYPDLKSNVIDDTEVVEDDDLTCLIQERDAERERAEELVKKLEFIAVAELWNYSSSEQTFQRLREALAAWRKG